MSNSTDVSSTEPVVAYAVEAIFWGALTALGLCLHGGTLLALRFAPKKKVATAKLVMQSIGLLCVLINIPRTLDLSAVYGRIDYATATLLHNIVTALQLFCLDVFILSTARALYLQLQKPIPQFYTIALLLSDGLYLLSIVILNAISYRAHAAIRSSSSSLSDKLAARDQLNLLWALRGIAFDVTLAIIIAINIVLFARLYRRLSQFIKTVEQQAKNTAITSEASGPSIGTISRMQTFAKTVTAATKQKPQSGSPQGSPSHKPRASPPPTTVPLLPQRTGKSLPASPILKGRNAARSSSGGGEETAPKSPQLDRSPSKPTGQGALFVRTKSAGQSLQPTRLDMNPTEPLTPPINSTDGSSPLASSPSATVGANAATTGGATAGNGTAVPPSVTVSVGETGEQNSGSGELVLRIFPNTPVAGDRGDGAPDGVDRRISDDGVSGPPTPSRPATPIATPSNAAGGNASGPPPLTPPRPATIHLPTTPMGSSSPGQQPRTLGRTMSIDARPQPVVRAITVRGAQIPASPAGGPPVSRTTTQATFGRTTTASSAPAQTSHDTRVKELRKAVRTLSILSGCVFFIGLASIAWDLPDSLASLFGSYASDESLYGPRPEEYGLLHNAFPLIQQINLAIIAWYCWTPWYFRSKYRTPNKIGFWAGLRYGYQEAGGSRMDSKYAPEATSKKGAGDSKLLRQATQKSVQRTHTMSMAMPPTQAAAAAALAAAQARKEEQAGSPQPISPAPSASPLALLPAPSKKAWGSMDVTAAGANPLGPNKQHQQAAANRHKPLGSTDNDSEDDD